MTVLVAPTLETLSAICRFANEEAFGMSGERSTCIWTSAALCDVLETLGIPARPMRVCATIYPSDGSRVCATAGFEGDGSRRRAADPGMWNGHLAVIADERFLLDPTQDQLAGGAPFCAEISTAFLTDGTPMFWGEGFGAPAGIEIRYYTFPNKGGWKSKPGWRNRSYRRLLADMILERMYEEGVL